MKLDTQTFIDRARQVHGDRYDYSTVVYKRSTSKVKITCHEHGPFFQAPENHVNQNQHCPKCANLRKGKHDRYSMEWMLQRPERAYAPALLYVATVQNRSDTFLEVGVMTTSITTSFRQSTRALTHLHYMSLKDALHLQEEITKMLENNLHCTNEIAPEKTRRFNNEKSVLESLQEILPKTVYPYK